MDINQIYEAANIMDIIHDPTAPRLVINKDKVVNSNTVDGLEVYTKEIENGVSVELIVRKGKIIPKPVHLCFGITDEQAVQYIIINAKIEDNAEVSLLAHCVFPVAKDIVHKMDAEIFVGKNSKYSYFERHIHSETGGVKVIPKTKVKLDENSRFKTEFELIKGRVGSIDLDIEASCGDKSVVEMTTRISGTEDDKISIRETGYLEGLNSRGALTSRIAVRNNSQAQVYNKLVATGSFSRGHVDCKEVVKDNAIASAVPIVEVKNPTAHITHEASIGSVDLKQLETLMSRGLSEEEATELIIQGLLS